MIIDILAVVLLAVAVFKGLSKGLIVALFSLLAYVVGLAAALKLSSVVAGYLSKTTNISQRWLPLLAFMLVFIVVILLVRLGARAIEKAVALMMMGWLNKLGGVVFYFLLYLFIFSLLLFYAVQLHLIKDETVHQSHTAEMILPFGPLLVDGLGYVLPLFRNMFEVLEDYFP